MIRDRVQRDAAAGRGSVLTTPDATACPIYDGSVADAEIGYRVGWRQLPWYLAIWPVLHLAFDHDRLGGVAFRAIALVLLVVVAVETIWLKSMGVDLTPEALVVRGTVRRVVPWGEVRAMGVEPLLWSRTVVVTTYDGRRHRLRAPVHTPFLAPDPDFKGKADAMYFYWLAHRPEGWTPPSQRWATSAGSSPSRRAGSGWCPRRSG
jgi:hypothetical protein